MQVVTERLPFINIKASDVANYDPQLYLHTIQYPVDMIMIWDEVVAELGAQEAAELDMEMDPLQVSHAKDTCTAMFMISNMMCYFCNSNVAINKLRHQYAQQCAPCHECQKLVCLFLLGPWSGIIQVFLSLCYTRHCL